MFHKLTRERDLAIKEGDAEKIKSCDNGLEEMGGRPEYQRASQLSTSFHSTSKWVLGHLANNGWLYGIKTKNDNGNQTSADTNAGNSESSDTGESRTKREKKRTTRRTTRILEVGAINTELLDAAGVTVSVRLPVSAAAASSSSREGRERNDTKTNEHSSSSPVLSSSQTTTAKKNIHVRAIDIHSMEERIEEADFLKLPIVDTDPEERCDVIVCSMVLNCVTTPVDRGKMLALLYHQLRPGGLCFFTIPKFCLTKSAFLTHNLFKKMLGENGVGFNVKSTKESPKVAFFILERPIEDRNSNSNGNEGKKKTKSGTTYTRRRQLDPSFKKAIIRNKGKKFPNQFSVVLRAEHIFGTES